MGLHLGLNAKSKSWLGIDLSFCFSSVQLFLTLAPISGNNPLIQRVRNALTVLQEWVPQSVKQRTVGIVAAVLLELLLLLLLFTLGQSRQEKEFVGDPIFTFDVRETPEESTPEEVSEPDSSQESASIPVEQLEPVPVLDQPPAALIPLNPLDFVLTEKTPQPPPPEDSPAQVYGRWTTARPARPIRRLLAPHLMVSRSMLHVGIASLMKMR